MDKSKYSDVMNTKGKGMKWKILTRGGGWGKIYWLIRKVKRKRKLDAMCMIWGIKRKEIKCTNFFEDEMKA